MNKKTTYDIPTFGYVNPGNNDSSCRGQRVIVSPKTGAKILFDMGHNNGIAWELNDKFFCSPKTFMKYDCITCVFLSMNDVPVINATTVELTIDEINSLLEKGRRV